MKKAEGKRRQRKQRGKISSSPLPLFSSSKNG
jgi:hypothetical protein